MRILVNRTNIEKAVKSLSFKDSLAIDTETTGLEPYFGDRLFSVIISCDENQYYFDFKSLLRKDEHLKFIQEIIDNTKTIYFVNFSFDFLMLHFDGISLKNKRIIDGGVIARLHYSLHDPTGSKADNQFFSLDYLASKYLGRKKDDTVKNYIKDNKLYSLDRLGKEKPDYTKVPLEMMFNYGCIDAELTYKICDKILKEIKKQDDLNENKRPKKFKNTLDLVEQESKLTYVLAQVNLTGMKLDIDFVEKAIKYENEIYNNTIKEIRSISDININSPKQVINYVHNVLKLELPKKIIKGKWNGSYTADAKSLEELAENSNAPVLSKIVKAKQSLKKVSTYYLNFKKLMNEDGKIRCGLGQETTTTGRLSSFNPNLQNLSKEKFHEYALRNSFIASKGFSLLFLDFKGQEMYILLDLAGAKDAIERVKNGEDIYLVMCDLVKEHTGVVISRNQAKALALGISYGQGAPLIAKNLKTSVDEAKRLKSAFLKALRSAQKLNDWAKDTATRYGKIFNPFGRVSYINKGFEYKALNALIQGTAADVTKKALIDCYEFLIPYKSNIVLQVHDEIIFELADDEHHLIPELSRIMSAAYNHFFLPLRVDIEISKTSWAAKTSYDLAA